MVFQENRKGNIEIVLLLCAAILFMSTYFIQNIVELHNINSLRVSEYSDLVLQTSIYDVAISSIIDNLDGSTFSVTEGDYIIDNTLLNNISNNIKTYLGVTESVTSVALSAANAIYSPLTLTFNINDRTIIFENIVVQINEIDSGDGAMVVDSVSLDFSNVRISID